MLIKPHDKPLSDEEWRAFLRDHDFGELIAPGNDRDLPVVVPAHFVYDGDKTVLLHLAKPNPVWDALAERPRALLSVFGAYTYVASYWNQGEHGVPTSYYAAVQLAGDIEVIDDEAEIARILATQLEHFQPEGRHAPVAAGDNPYGKLLSAIRGIRMTVTDVRAKFKFGMNRTEQHRRVIAERLAERGRPLDLEARDNVLRRLPSSGRG